eukprot:Gb_35007 [translate_table: standard]
MDDTDAVDKPLVVVVSVVSLLSVALGLVPSLFVGVDVWRAFRKKKHWIPNDALLLTALTLQLLTLHSRSADIGVGPDYLQSILSKNKLCGGSDIGYIAAEKLCPVRDNYLLNDWLCTLARTMVVCVSIGILLPGVACPRSPNLWSNMLALVISPWVVLLPILYDIYKSVRGFQIFGLTPGFRLWLNITLFILIILLLLLPWCAALASVSIHHMLALKIPLNLSTAKCKSRSCSQQLWDTVEDQVHNSWIIVLVRNPQYIIARSYLSSSTALVVTICIGFCIAIPLTTLGMLGFGSLADLIQCGFILVAWIVICWRGLTAVVYFPRTMQRRAFHFRQCFHVEDSWKRHLIKLIDEFKEEGEIEGSFLKRLILKTIRTMRLHKLLPLVLWLQVLLVLLSKASCKVENGVQHSGSASFVKYSEAFIHMPGENPAGLWIANHKSIEKMKNRVKYMDPKAFAPKLQVERQFNVSKRSWKMTAVSLITVIIELSAFTENGSAVTDAMEACSQAWQIMDFVEKSDPEAALINEAADKVFYQKGKEIAMADLPGQDSTDWKTLAAGYSLYRICERVKGRLSNVKAMLDELQKSLADVIGECIEKVAGVIMEDCREWAVSMDEEKVWKAGLVAGKAKGVIQKVGWNLKWTDDGVRVQSRKEEDDDIEVGNVANRSAFLKFPTFNDV